MLLYSASSRKGSNPSGLSVKPDHDTVPVHDDRHAAVPFGVFEHGVHFTGIRQYIFIDHLSSIICVCFPSSSGEGSGVFPKNGDGIRHGHISFQGFLF